MLNTIVSTKKMFDNAVDCYAYIVEKNFKTSAIADAIKICPDLQAVIKQRNFIGAALETIVVPFTSSNKLAYCCLIGFGEAKSNGGVSAIERYRRAVGQLIKTVSAHNVKLVAVELVSPSKKISFEYLIEQTAITADIAHYHFDD